MSETASGTGPACRAVSPCLIGLAAMALVACGGGGGSSGTPATDSAGLQSGGAGTVSSGGSAGTTTTTTSGTGAGRTGTDTGTGSTIGIGIGTATTGIPTEAPTASLPAPTRVNTTLAQAQADPDIAQLAGGATVVVWRSGRASGAESFGDVYAQRFDAAGVRLGAETLISSGTVQAGAAAWPRVAALAGGGFVVTWNVAAGPSTQGGTTRDAAHRMARLFDASGAALGPEFQVNRFFDTPRDAPSDITPVSGGGFVITWPSFETSIPTVTIHSQRYDAIGALVGGDVRVSDPNAGRVSATTALSQGGHAVMWSAQDSEIRPIAILRLQRFDSAGSPVGATSEINTSVLGSHPTPALAALSNGGFAAVWAAVGGSRIDLQLLDAAGMRIGTEINVATSLNGHPLRQPRVIALGSSGFAVSWLSPVVSGTGFEQQLTVRRFDNAGTPLGDSVRVSTNQVPTIEDRYGVTATPDSASLAFAWPGYSDASSWDVFWQRMVPAR